MQNRVSPNVVKTTLISIQKLLLEDLAGRKIMSNRRSPFGSFKNITQIEIAGDVAIRASVHENNRQNEIKKVLVHTFMMARFGIINPGDAVTAKKAEAQHISGTGGTQAAHCLPCQILIKNDPLQNHLVSVSDELFIEVATSFSTTDILPTNFNKADSLAEGNLLKEAFRTACAQAVQAAHNLHIKDPRRVAPHIETIFGGYQGRASVAFQNSINHLQGTILTATGAKKAEREERQEILRVYQRTLNSASASLDTVMFLHVEDLYKTYRELTGNS